MQIYLPSRKKHAGGLTLKKLLVFEIWKFLKSEIFVTKIHEQWNMSKIDYFFKKITKFTGK